MKALRLQGSARRGLDGQAGLTRRRAQTRKSNFDANHGALEDTLTNAASKCCLRGAYSLGAYVVKVRSGLCAWVGRADFTISHIDSHPNPRFCPSPCRINRDFVPEKLIMNVHAVESLYEVCMTMLETYWCCSLPAAKVRMNFRTHLS